MLPLIKLILLLAFMIFLISRKIKVGYVLMLATAATEAIFYIPVEKFVIPVLSSTFTPKTITIVVMIFSILVLSNFMKDKKLLSELISNLSSFVKSKKILNICLPAFIGLLPMPGGALFSAPMVDEGLKDTDFTKEEKTYINYWFRHIWEYILPLYPGIILTSGIFGISNKTLFFLHLPFTVAMIVIGYFTIFFNREVKSHSLTKPSFKSLINVLKSISPVLIILCLSIVFNINVAVSMIVTLIFCFIIFKAEPKDIKKYLKSALNFDMLIMVLGIFYFKEALEVTGAISLLPSIFHSGSYYTILMLIFLPFITGLLTGITLAYVGISFPILSVYIVNSQGLNLNFEMLAYISGFLGVLLSPVHLCLLLTNEYFDSELKKVYKYIIKSSIALFIFLLWMFWLKMRIL
jgi:integral membrane protein (TIGR00529 family)